MSEKADFATYRIMLRAFAPHFRDTILEYSHLWKEPVSNLYMIMRYKNNDAKEFDDLVIVVKSFTNKEHNAIVPIVKDNGNKNAQELLPVAFEMFKEMINDASKDWNVQLVDKFASFCYKTTKNLDDADTVEIKVRTKKGIEPPRLTIINDGF